MPLELLFETSLARAMTNLETYHSQGLLLVNLFGDVPPERIRKCLFPTGRFQTWPLKSIPVFRPIKQGSQTRHKWTGIKFISSLL